MHIVQPQINPPLKQLQATFLEHVAGKIEMVNQKMSAVYTLLIIYGQM